MRSSSASWRTRSLKSSQDSSRLKYSSVESSGGASRCSVRASVASAIRCSVPSFDRTPAQLVQQARAEALALQPLPLAQEARVEDLAARSEVSVQCLETTIEEPVRRLADGRRVEVLAVPARRAPQRRGVARAEPGDVRLHARGELVAVVHLA